MAVINQMAEALGRLQSDELNVFPYRCVVMRNRNASCLKCAQACTSGAISVDEEGISVDPELCVGCGTCATVCPTCALEARHPNDAALSQQATAACEANEGRAVIACERAWEARAGQVDPERAARVTCLGRVEESLLAQLAADGATSVTLVHGSCADCPRNNGTQTYELVCETARQLFEAWGVGCELRVSDKMPASVRLEKGPAGGLAYDESRRNLLAQAGQVVAAGVAETLPGGGAEADEDGPAPRMPLLKVMKDGTLPHFVPDRRERLLDALAELGEPEEVALDTRLWGRVTIDASKCRTCYMCAVFCPTGALSRFADEDGTVGVEHTPADCVKCRCCTDVCPTGALTLHEDVLALEVAAADVVERMELPPVTDDRGGAHSMYDALKKLIKCDQFYER